MKKSKTGMIVLIVALAVIAASAAVICVLFASGAFGSKPATDSNSVVRVEQKDAVQTNSVSRVNEEDTDSILPPITTNSVIPDNTTYTAVMNIKYKWNAIMAKYNIDLIIDGEKIDTIGNNSAVEYQLTKTGGTHTIRCEKNGDSSVFGENTFHIYKEDEIINIEIKTHEKYIEITSSVK